MTTPTHRHDHAEQQCNFWAWCGITHIDCANRFPSGAWVNNYDCSLCRKSLAGVRSANARRQADAYIRPARDRPAALIFLDDVHINRAHHLLANHAGLAIRTSSAGACHLWLRLTTPCTVATRAALQRHLLPQAAADPASVSGDHYGRLAGTRNHKRGGCWITCLAENRHAPAIDPMAILSTPDTNRSTADTTGAAHRVQHRRPDTSASAREWGWVCGQLANGIPADRVLARLIEAARPRRGTDTERYARYTVTKAAAVVGNQNSQTNTGQNPTAC